MAKVSKIQLPHVGNLRLPPTHTVEGAHGRVGRGAGWRGCAGHASTRTQIYPLEMTAFAG